MTVAEPLRSTSRPPAEPMSRFRRFVEVDYATRPDVLGAFRVCFGVLTLWLGPPPIRALADLPDVAFEPPPGLARLWQSWPPPEVLFALDAMWICFALLVTIGWRTRASSIALAAVTIVSSSILFSTGKIDHTVFTALVPLLGGLAGWGNSVSFDAKRAGHSNRRPPTSANWPLSLLAGLLALGFFTAAVPKIAGGWLDPRTQAAEGYFRDDLLLRDRTDLLAPLAARVESSLVWELLDVATVAFELGVAVALLNALWFRRTLLVAVGFHVGVLAIMNISFLALPPVYALLLLPGLDPTSAQRLAARVHDRQPMLWIAALALAVMNLWQAPTTALVNTLDVSRLGVRAAELGVMCCAVVWLGLNQRRPTDSTV